MDCSDKETEHMEVLESSESDVGKQEVEFCYIQKYLTEKVYPDDCTKDYKRALRRKAKRYLHSIIALSV